MVEFHGWAVISDNAYESDFDILENIVKGINKRIDTIKGDNQIFELKAINGKYMLAVAGFTNHKSQDVIEVLDFFSEIPKVAPGSYGLLYMHDDEDKEDKDDVFRIWKIAKGELTVIDDQLLSPCSKVIFD
jgi:hypothetical protein